MSLLKWEELLAPLVQREKEAQRDRQQLAQGHLEKRAEPGLKGPGSVRLHYPVLLSASRLSELFVTCTDYHQSLKG